MDNNYEMLKLNNQICFPLYACSKEVVRKYKPYLDEIDLTYTQYITMMVLWEHRSLSVKELGQYIYLDSGTLTPLLKILEKKGLITRGRSAEDERMLQVEVTEAGLQLRKKASEIPAKMSGCIELDPEDAKNLYRILHDILGQM